MSQADTATPTKSTATRKERIEAFLRSFEWTWTSAVVFSLGLVFFLLITTSVIPSFWLYFADAELKWNNTAPQKILFWTIDGFWLMELRDAVAMGLSTVPIILVLVVASIMQNWRRKLRGASDSRTTGGYR